MLRYGDELVFGITTDYDIAPDSQATYQRY